MTICLRCRRPLKHPTPSGLGPVCAKAVPPLEPGVPDLFPYDLDRLVHEARQRLEAFINASAAAHRREIRKAFYDASIRADWWQG